MVTVQVNMKWCLHAGVKVKVLARARVMLMVRVRARVRFRVRSWLVLGLGSGLALSGACMQGLLDSAAFGCNRKMSRE